MIKKDLSRFKNVSTAGLVLLSLALLAGCSAPKDEAGAKIVQIDNTKATKIVSMGTLTEKQVEKVQDLSKSEVKDNKVVATDGTKVPQKQVESVVDAINTGDNKKVETALEKAPEVKEVITAKPTTNVSSSKEVTKLEEAESYAGDKVDGKKVQEQLKKTGTTVDSKEAESIAGQYNLANVIQLNAQKKFPDDVINISGKRDDGTYVLMNISTGETYVINVDGSGNITKMTKEG